MGRLLLLLTSVAGMSLFGPSFHQADRDLRAGRNSAERVAATQARAVALTGHGAARLAVLDDLEADGSYDGPTPIVGEYGGGQFSTDVSVADPVVTIVTRALHSGVEHVVRATYEASGGVVTVPPEYMRGALVSQGNLPVMDQLTIRTSDPASPASLRVGGNLEFREGSDPTLIEGFAEASGNVVFRTDQGESDVFQPLANPDGLSLTQAKQPKFDVPDFRAGDHAHLATRTLSSGLYSGTIPLGTASNPEILYIGGNFETSGPITFTGYGVVLVDGNFIINHDMRSDGANPVGFYATSNFELRSGSLTIDGNILNGGNTKFMDDTTINGSVTAGSNLEFSGAAAINYIPAAANITEPFWPGESSTTAGAASAGYRLTRVSENRVQ